MGYIRFSTDYIRAVSSSNSIPIMNGCMRAKRQKIYFRVDGSSTIGAGHVVRCVSIAQEVEVHGGRAVFVSSNEESAKILRKYNFESLLIGGDPKHLGEFDAQQLANVMDGNTSVLVDSYGVTDEFFDTCVNLGLKVAYIDDMYTYETGGLSDPVRRNVRVLINYSFGSSEEDYAKVYRGADTKLLIGPKYAPVRKIFREKAGQYQVRDKVENVLITTGSTNPSRSLEKISQGCRDALPDVHISVVVGPNAVFDDSLVSKLNLHLIKGVTDLSDYMLASDLVISAAGITLYELYTLGVPTIAVPIVENQLTNARGFRNSTHGYALNRTVWNSRDITEQIKKIESIKQSR